MGHDDHITLICRPSKCIQSFEVCTDPIRFAALLKNPEENRTWQSGEYLFSAPRIEWSQQMQLTTNSNELDRRIWKSLAACVQSSATHTIRQTGTHTSAAPTQRGHSNFHSIHNMCLYEPQQCSKKERKCVGRTFDDWLITNFRMAAHTYCHKWMGIVCLCADNQREAVEKKLSSMNGVETLYIFLLDITIIRVFGVFVFCLLFC